MQGLCYSTARFESCMCDCLSVSLCRNLEIVREAVCRELHERNHFSNRIIKLL